MLLIALLLVKMVDCKTHYIDRSEYEASHDESDIAISGLANANHDKLWKTATTEDSDPHGDADEEHLSIIKDRLEKKLSMDAGIPVNLEPQDIIKTKNQNQTASVTNNTTNEENNDESSDSIASGD